MKVRVVTLNKDIDSRIRRCVLCAVDVDSIRQKDLSNIQNVRLRKAFQLDPSIEFAYNWIQAHEMEFEAKVYLPPMVSVNVPNRNYAWQVEMCTSIAQRKVRIGVTPSLTKDLYLSE